jgi:hypothetical protein
MPQQGGLAWVDGNGWLVFSGGGDWRRGATDVVDANALSLANLDRPTAVILSEGAPADVEGILEHYVALGGAGGEGVVLAGDAGALQDEVFLSALGQAGLLYLGGERPLTLASTLHRTQALRLIVQGFATMQGLVIVGAGGGAAALGAWVRSAVGEESPGLNFLRNGIVTPHFTKTEEADLLRKLLRDHPGFVGLGVPDGSALALGPRGEVETWGDNEITAVISQA